MDSSTLRLIPSGLKSNYGTRTLSERRKYLSSSSSSSSSFFACLLPSLSQKLRLRGNSNVVAATKKESKNGAKKKKQDSHSFIPRPNEATGPFPEAVLLKERKVEDDGRLIPEFADADERELFEALNLQLESDMDVDRMQHYEVVYLIHENYKDEVANVNTKIEDFLREKKGKIWRFNDWGLRRLAYIIQKAKNAHYILMNFEMEAKWINDFKSLLDRDERVIRHLVMKQDKAETRDCPSPPEFHTLRADMNNDDDKDEDDDDDDDEGIIYIDEVEEDDELEEVTSSNGNSKQNPQKVAL